MLSSTAEPSWLETTTSPGRSRCVLRSGDAALLLEVVAHPPFAVDPDAWSSVGAQRRANCAVRVPVLVIGGGEAEAEGQLDGEAGRQPAAAAGARRAARPARPSAAGSAPSRRRTPPARRAKKMPIQASRKRCPGRGACARRGPRRRDQQRGRRASRRGSTSISGVGELGRELSGDRRCAK